jgi:polygalacturonase
MRLHLRHVGPTSASFEILNGYPATSPWLHEVELNGCPVYRSERNVFTLHNLRPDTKYTVGVRTAGARFQASVQTRPVSHLVDIRDFGARNEPSADNTGAIQAAILSSPPHSMVQIPPGQWLSGPLFLRSRVHLHLSKGATLLGHPDIARWPVLPASITGAAADSITYLGSWEGIPEDMHCGLLTAINVHDVCISGEGCIDANASFSTWWSRPKGRFQGRRPRTLYLLNCKRIGVVGVTIRNSPSWSIHAHNSRLLRFVDVDVQAPADSPNTDGINPESCEDVLIAGARISVGDDCIALKSGKRADRWIPMRATRRVAISNCVLRHGHAGIALGSEMSGGIYGVKIRDCLLEGTERGLRIKTRRGRGSKAIIDGVWMENVRMNAVGTPFVINSFYDCDLPRDAIYERNRREMPIDDGTPTISGISLRDVTCDNVQHSAAYVLGLPERPVDGLNIERYSVRLDPCATAGFPDKALGIEPVTRSGLYFCNVRGLRLRDITVEGAEGRATTLENTELIEE